MMRRLALACGVAVALVGCQHRQPTIYQWESYQPQVYQYFKGESPEAQIAVLEKDLQKINAQGMIPPPGYHAHLGLLYSVTGKPEQMAAEFEAEKMLFPESAAYMDFLLKNTKKAVQ
ncbi:hypothetical protein SAMN05518865_111128 [Duganella sp. CF458]|uniref:DUF4810 domain-containing protein n=1 Tax=Duganella sp. CF458 TaxID=1884368 RepID=UPI0008EE3B00|nr:DUF4810 domain-containing protein [Duganella sp. CF458]SFG37356.1 hypothetical protein SAMN05518865_111128 [Duganella sp. CF458]